MKPGVPASPRVATIPPYATSSGADAVKLAATAGLILDDWQCYVLTEAMGEDASGLWSAFETGLLVPRQNGKSALLAARALFGLFILGENVVWSAHQVKTSLASFRYIKSLVEGCPALLRRVEIIRRGSGQESIELKDGPTLRFLARSTQSGRGFTNDCLLLDEAQELSDLDLEAMLPTLSARPNPCVWFAGTVPGPENNNPHVFTRLRDRGRAGDPGLCWLEWSAGEDLGDLDDKSRWQLANPALGIRITQDFIERERASLTDEGFARERLSIWPSGASAGLFGSAWGNSLDRKSGIVKKLTLGVAVSIDRSYACIGASGLNAEGLIHLEPIERQRGTDWVVARVQELVKQHGRPGVVIDAGGPGASLIQPLIDARVKVTQASTRDVTDACAQLYDAVLENRVRHLGDPDLDAAVMGAQKRPVGDRWAIGRKSSLADVSPLEAVVLAAHGSRSRSTYDVLSSIH